MKGYDTDISTDTLKKCTHVMTLHAMWKGQNHVNTKQTKKIHL